MNASFGPCIILVNGSDLFPISSTLSQALKTAVWHNDKTVPPCSACIFISAYWLSPRSWSWELLISLALYLCSISFFLHHGHHCKWGPASNMVFVISLQSWRITLFWIAPKFTICFMNGEYIPYEIMALIFFNIATPLCLSIFLIFLLMFVFYQSTFCIFLLLVSLKIFFFERFQKATMAIY